MAPLCVACGEDKSSDEILKTGPWKTMCRACAILIGDLDHPSWQRAYGIQYSYGLDYKDYLSMHTKQHGSCEICSMPIAKFKNDDGVPTAHVDHDHETGEVRGLLCRGCNTGLGMFKDDPTLLDAAIDYLLRSLE